MTGRRTRTDGIVALAAIAIVVVAGAGCGSSNSSYIHPNVDFTYMKRAAILPFQNLTTDFQAGERMQSIFLMELLNEDVLTLVDPRETAAAMKELSLPANGALTTDQVLALGKKLDVQALFSGSVEEYGYGQGDRSRGPVITATFTMTETQTGVLVWRAQAHSTGASFRNKLFGGGPKDLYDVSRKTVHDALRSLLE